MSLTDELGAPSTPAPALPARLRAAEYARARGLTGAAISQAIGNGRIRRGDDGLISVAEADSYWRGAKRAPPSLTLAGNAAVSGPKQRKLEADAKISEIKAAEAARELVHRDAVSAAWFAVLRSLRQRLLALPAAVESRCDGLTPSERIAEWDRSIRDALVEVPSAAPGVEGAFHA